MKNKFYDTFNKIKADESLKQKTAVFLEERIKNTKKNKFNFKVAVACASFILLAFVSAYYLYFTPISYVDIDVNPSVELLVNRFGKVIDVEAYNEDGEEILQGINVRHINYEKAIDELIYAMEQNGYLTEDETMFLTVQTATVNKENSMVNDLKTKIDSIIKLKYENMESEVFAVTEEVRTSAHEKQMTPAKYLAISELQQFDTTATYESCRNHSMNEINQMIEKHGGSHHGQKEEGTQDERRCKGGKNHQ